MVGGLNNGCTNIVQQIQILSKTVPTCSFPGVLRTSMNGVYFTHVYIHQKNLDSGVFWHSFRQLYRSHSHRLHHKGDERQLARTIHVQKYAVYIRRVKHS